jgi:RNA:NAD 2'-phosphotransferase (TPT1/KptA family)
LKDWGFSFVVDLFIMAMIKLKELIEERYVYHVTPKKNLPSIKSQGILPSALTPS